MEPTSDVSEFSVELAHKFLTAYLRAGGTTAEADAIAQDETLMRNLLASYRAKKAGLPTLVELIALGSYDDVDPGITAERFPVESDGTDGDPVLVCLNRNATTDEVLADMRSLGLKPGRIEHQLVYGAKNPEEQRKYRIAALGSSLPCPDGSDDYELFPFLYEDDGRRRLGLYKSHPHGQWRVLSRFLALRM